MTRHLLLVLLLVLTACDGGGSERLATPVAHPEAAARGFQLFYRERVERAVLAWNRFALVGDAVGATTMGRVAVARDGDHFEVVPGPDDNNRIGTSAFATYRAYEIFRSRTLALTLIRMFDGLVFISEVSGHAGITARQAYPGWTRVMDGIGGTVVRTRDGAPVAPPTAPDPTLEQEILRTFFDGVTFTYRENPADTYFNFKPVEDVSGYSITYVFSELPRFIRSSDCCSSLMRTPQGYPWQGAFWGNHNSRDNSQDLAIGYLTALEAAADPLADRDVRAAARRAVQAGRRVGDLVQENGGRIMTVDEFHPYDFLNVSGELRPDGVLEPQDLGSLSACPRAYLQRAISSEGLTAPVPAVPLPGAIDLVIADALGPFIGLIDCEIPEGVPMCESLDEGYCGATNGELPELEVLGVPLGTALTVLDFFSPGTAAGLLGSFQDDYREIVAAAGALVYHAEVTGQPELLLEARAALAEQTEMLRYFADLVYGDRSPAQRAAQRYEAALREAIAGLPAPLEDIADFALAEERIARIEALLDLPPATPRALMSDDEIRATVDARVASLDGFDELRAERYRQRFGANPPVRRLGDGYEARGPDDIWRPVENPRHTSIGGHVLLEEIALCSSAPDILDCTWAAAGCARPDLDASGEVDSRDTELFESAVRAHADTRCRRGNGWCEGADLDRTGTIDGLDHAFLAAAQGCRHDPG